MHFEPVHHGQPSVALMTEFGSLTRIHRRPSARSMHRGCILSTSSAVSPISCIPFPQGLFSIFLLYNPTAMPSPAAFPSCIRRLTHCSAQLGCTSLPWDMGPHGCRQGLGLAHSEACTQLRAEASARVPPSLPLPRSFKLRCDGSAFLLPPRMAAAVTPQAFGHGLFNIFFQLSHLQSPELLPALLPWVR